MPDVRRVPFTEQVETLHKDIMRDNSTNEGKYSGRINDIYTSDIPPQLDWRHIRKEGTITTTIEYSTGTVETLTGTAVTGDSTVWTSANSNTMLLKMSGYDEVYRATYVGATSLTIDRTWIETDISSSTSYKLIQDRYKLASDFERMILDPDKSVYYWQDGNKVYLIFRLSDEFEEKQVVNSNTPMYYTIKWVNGSPYIFIDPPDDESRTIHYVYMPMIKPMFEYTTGTISTLANGATTVTGVGTDFVNRIVDTDVYTYYFRLDRDGTIANSEWYQIASITNATTLELSSNYLGTAVTGATLAFTISIVSSLPRGLDTPMIYGAAVIGATEQTNKLQITAWSALYANGLGQYKGTETKKAYGKRSLKTIYMKPGVRR